MSYTRVIFAGYSMYPTLRPGDTLILETVCVDDCAPGDIVCVGRADGFVAHRIVAIEKGKTGPRIITKGDNLTYSDSLIPPAETLSRVVMVSRGSRGLVRLRRGAVTALFSRANLTRGIVRGRIGALVRAARRRFSGLLRTGEQLP